MGHVSLIFLRVSVKVRLVIGVGKREWQRIYTGAVADEGLRSSMVCISWLHSSNLR